MIRQSPEVPGAVELADVARHILRNQFMFSDSRYASGWVWQSSQDFDPALRVVIPASSRIKSNGRFIVTHAVFVLVEDQMEYELGVPIAGAPNMPDDPYIEDFVQAFRQYQNGRSGLERDFVVSG